MVMESAMQLMPSAWQTARIATLGMLDRSCATDSMAPSYPIRKRKAVRYLGAQGSYALNWQLKK
jgi:hypothetical protein